MKKILLAALLIVPMLLQAQQERNYLQTEYNRYASSLNASTIAKWRTEQKNEILDEVKNLPDAIKQQWIKVGEEALNYKWTSLYATQFLEYKTIGNRTNYESSANERRRKLYNLVAAELVEHKGRFIHQIVNGLWLTLEESTWAHPAHIPIQKSGVGLPDPSQNIIDLGVGEVAVNISRIYLLLKDELDKVSPLISKRISYELNRRVAEPYLQQNFWWMGFSGGTINNWNIWVNTNVLYTVLIVVNDDSLRNKLLDKLMKSADKFINNYPDDGGCDEGPSYWSEAGGELIEFINIVNSISPQKIDWTKYELIHQIGSYISKVYIDSDRVVNFADASAKTIPSPQAVFAYGKIFSDSSLMQLGSWLYHLQNPVKENISTDNLKTCFNLLEYRNDILITTPRATYSAESWLPDLQVLTLRSNAGSSKGLFFAAQGGHNDESHNHNDVGNFILYVNGEPAIIDAGVGTYTAKTFSNQRYTLWNMQSQWHNCPTINGVMQKDGRQYAASDIEFKSGKIKTLKMNIAHAYPAEASVNEYERTFNFNGEKNELKLQDNYELKEWKSATQLNFITCLSAEVGKNGELLLKTKEGNAIMKVVYNAKQLIPNIETKLMDDVRLQRVWGNSIQRIVFIVKGNNTKDKIFLTFIKL